MPRKTPRREVNSDGAGTGTGALDGHRQGGTLQREYAASSRKTNVMKMMHLKVTRPRLPLVTSRSEKPKRLIIQGKKRNDSQRGLNRW